LGYFTVGGGQSRVRGIIYFLFVDYYKLEGRGNNGVRLCVRFCCCSGGCWLECASSHSRGFASIIKYKLGSLGYQTILKTMFFFNKMSLFSQFYFIIFERKLKVAL
jgi:hypothetical protein